MMAVWVVVPFAEMGNRMGAQPGHAGGEERLRHTRVDVKYTRGCTGLELRQETSAGGMNL